MKFSVVTPSFNQGRFLPDCVDSVLSQDGVEIEHIVIDAGSTDDTVDVLSRFPHLIWTSEPDQGMSDGINKGFLKATGDWVMWLNCDDFLLPGALARVAAFIGANPRADVVHGDCVFVREDRTVIRRKYDHPADELTLLFAGCFIPSTSTFLDRRIIDQKCLLDVTYRVCMDFEYYLRLMRSGYRFSYIPEAIAGFRWHGGNTSITYGKEGWIEAKRLQREHIAERGWSGMLGGRGSLAILRRVFQANRVVRRFGAHKRLY